jgi:hypothetical protein
MTSRFETLDLRLETVELFNQNSEFRIQNFKLIYNLKSKCVNDVTLFCYYVKF